MIPKAAIGKLAEVIGGLEAGATIIEAGCYDGSETRFILGALRAPPARYFAFEPDPRNVRRIRDAGLPGVVELVEAAISDADGEAELWQSEKGGVTGSSTLRDPAVHRTIHPDVGYPSRARVRTVRLDTFAAERGIDAVDFMFTDIEGSERNLIEGGRGTLARTRWWYTEQWDGIKCPLPYAGMWSRDELLANLPGWEMAACWEWDMLLRNTQI